MVYSPKQDGGKTCQKTKIGTGSTSTGTVILVSENHTGDVHVSADSRGSPAVKSNADKGEHNSHGSIEIISEELTSKDLKDFLRLGKNAHLHLDGTTTKESISVSIDLKSVSPTVIEGEACQTTDESSLGAKSNTHQDDGSIGSSQEGQGVSSQKLKIGIAGPESNTHLDDGSTLTDKGFMVSENNTCHVGLLSTTADGMLMGIDSCSSPAVKSNAGKGEACQTTDEFSLDSESNTHQDDGSTGRYRKGKGEIYQRSYVDDGSTASPVFLGGFQDGKAFLRKFDDFQEVTTSEVVKGFSSQKLKIGIAGPENNTHIDDGSTSTDKGFMVSEKNTCHVDLSTTADGIVNEAISKEWEGGLYLADAINLLQFRRNAPHLERDTDRYDGLTTKESTSVRNDLKSVSPTVIEGGNTYRHLERNTDVRYYCVRDTFGPTKKEAISLLDDLSVTGKGKTPQRSDVPCPDSESNTPQEDADSQESKVQGSYMETLPSDIVQESVPVEGSKTPQRTDVPSPDSEGETKTLGFSSQKIKIGIADLESNTHLDDGSTWTDKGFLVSENNTCHVDLSTTADGIVNEAISKEWEGETPQRTHVPCLDSESNTPQEDADSGVSQEVQGSSMESLPSDIVQDILLRVPTESVLECKLVCKKWVTVIRRSNFANMHLLRQLNHLYGGNGDDNDNLAAEVESSLFFACRINHPDVYKILLFNGGQLSDRIRNAETYVYSQNLKRIYHPPTHNELLHNHLVGSCNGLVCAYQQHHLVLDPIYICNPLTREYVHLPQLVVRKEDVDREVVCVEGGQPNMLGLTACGFGYLSSTNEYKVVRVYYLGLMEGNVEVYTLGSGRGWRAIGEISHRLDTMLKEIGTYANDAIYWTSYKKVVAFDLAKEEFQFLPVPGCVENLGRRDRCGLVALGGHLCLYVDDKLHVKIWSLTKSGESWRMEFDIDYEAILGTRKRNLQPILLAKGGEIILLYADSVLYSYDPKTGDLKMISNNASTDNLKAVEAIAHVNTFASLEAMGENSKKYAVRAPLEDVRDFDRVVLAERIDTTHFRLG